MRYIDVEVEEQGSVEEGLRDAGLLDTHRWGADQLQVSCEACAWEGAEARAVQEIIGSRYKAAWCPECGAPVFPKS